MSKYKIYGIIRYDFYYVYTALRGGVEIIMNTTERFLKYVSFPTMSDEGSETVPSSKKQLALSEYIRDELIALGLSDVELDSYGYLYATLPSNCNDSPVTLGLIAHVDTSDACADSPIITKIVEYKGEDVCLNPDKNIYLKEADYPFLANY